MPRINPSGILELGRVDDYNQVFWGIDSFTDDPHTTWILLQNGRSLDAPSKFQYEIVTLANKSGRFDIKRGSMPMPYPREAINPWIRVVTVNDKTRVFLMLKSGKEFSFCAILPDWGMWPGEEDITAQEFIDKERNKEQSSRRKI